MSLIVLYSILGANLLFSFIFSLKIYLSSKKYYKPLFKIDKDNTSIDLHKKYDPFHPHDKLNFFQLWLGAFFFAFIKFLSSFLILVFLNWHIHIINKIYKDCDTNPIHRKKLKNVISCYSRIFLIMNGVIIKKRNLEYKDIYKKIFR